MKMNEKIRNMTIGLFCAATVSILLTGCGSGEATKQSAAADDSLDTIIEKAKEEGEIASLGMPRKTHRFLRSLLVLLLPFCPFPVDGKKNL